MNGFGPFPSAARALLYELIAARRDVRHFAPTPVADEVLRRILGAAHAAPSVGMSQPWRFVLVRSMARRERIRAGFLACREREAARFAEPRRSQYRALKLEGIVEAPLNVCAAVDLRVLHEPVLGTTAQPDTLRASVVCAVQNLWLAARAEGLGVGWVSIVEPALLRAELALPEGVEPVAYLCLGHPALPYARPMLEEAGWRGRVPLDEVLHAETFGGSELDL